MVKNLKGALHSFTILPKSYLRKKFLSMKLYPVFAILIVCFVFSCLNSDDEPIVNNFDPLEQWNQENDAFQDYFAQNNLNPQFDSLQGFYFTIDSVGVGNNPNINSIVTVRYKGYLLDGTVFDETMGSDSVAFSLTRVIRGWQLGIPKYQKGGKGTLFLPSFLAYGTQGSGPIPPNTPLIFDVELLDFQ